MRERPPVLRYEDGSWRTLLMMSAQRRFVRAVPTNSIARTVVDLRPPIRTWLGQHDPECQIICAGYGVWLIFSDENAAMLFRLTYNAAVFRQRVS